MKINEKVKLRSWYINEKLFITLDNKVFNRNRLFNFESLEFKQSKRKKLFNIFIHAVICCKCLCLYHLIRSIEIERNIPHAKRMYISFQCYGFLTIIKRVKKLRFLPSDNIYHSNENIKFD